jgi:hypothetical protein
MSLGANGVREWLDGVVTPSGSADQVDQESVMSGSPTYVDREASVPMDIDDDDDDHGTLVDNEDEGQEGSGSEDEDDDEDWEMTQVVRVHDGRIPPPGHVSDLMIGPLLWVIDASGFDDDSDDGEHRLSMVTLYTHHGDMPLPAESTIWHTSHDSSPWSLQQALRSREPLQVGVYHHSVEARPQICGVASERNTIEFLENSFLCTVPTTPTTWGTYLLILRGACVSEPQIDIHQALMRKWTPSFEAAQDHSPASLANIWRESIQEAMREWGEDHKARFDPLLQTNLFQLDNVAAHDQYHLEVHAATLPPHLVPPEA